MRPGGGARDTMMELESWAHKDTASLRSRPGAAGSTARAGALPMARAVRALLQRAWSRGRQRLVLKFAQHGHWISHHQTFTLLLCNLVIASLFYPAVVMYLLTTSEDFSVSGQAPTCVPREAWRNDTHGACVTGAGTPTNIWDMALASLRDLSGATRADVLSDTYPVQDLRLFWDETPALEVLAPVDDAPDVYVAQALVTTDAVRRSGGSPFGVLARGVLQAALSLQTELDSRLLGDGGAAEARCVPRNDTRACLVLSPLEFWERNATLLRLDPHPAKSYTGSPARAVFAPPVAPVAPHSPIPLLYSTTLSSRWPFLPLFSRAEYAVLTYFLTAPVDWDALVAAAAAQVAPADVQAPADVATGTTTLAYKSPSTTARPALHYKVVVLCYAFLLGFIFRGLVQMRRLHSRFGMAFTGGVQLSSDLVMSQSLCALLGLRLHAVPWAVLPLIIVVVGGETMLYMIRAVTDTPLSLTVSSRVAYGLSQVAGPITLSSISDVAILSVLAWASPLESVTQFALFTIVALVVDYFMQMTFFVAVLSIDIQRLELAEMLVQGARGASSDDAPRDGAPARHGWYRPRSVTALLFALVQSVWRRRRVRALGLAALAALAWAAVSGRSALAWLWGGAEWWSPGHAFHARSSGLAEAVSDASPYGALWRALNPEHAAYLRVHLLPWSRVSFAGANDAWADVPPVAPPWFEFLFFERRGTVLFLFVLFVVVPITLSGVILWLVLWYLQKNSDKLEGAASRQAGDDQELRRLLHEPAARDTRDLALQLYVQVDALHPGAIVCHAASAGAVVSADTQNTVRVDAGGSAHLAALAELRAEHALAADASAITAVAVDDAAAPTSLPWIAIGQASGRVTVWGGTPRGAWDAYAPPPASAGVLHVYFHQDHVVWVQSDGAWLAVPLHGRRSSDVSRRVTPSMPAAGVALASVTASSGGAGVALACDGPPRQPSPAPAAAPPAPPVGAARHRAAEALRLIEPRGPRTAWALAPLDGPRTATWLGMASRRGELRVYRTGGDTLAPVLIGEVQHPDGGVLRCGVLLTAEDTPDLTNAPPKHAADPAGSSLGLLTGDQNGLLHWWALRPAACVASAAVPAAVDSAAASSAILRLVAVSPQGVVAQTLSHAVPIELRTATPRLVVHAPLGNPRGVLDVVTHDASAWILGLCRTDDDDGLDDDDDVRWKIWRARYPAPPAAPRDADVERIPVPLEALLRSAVRALVAAGRHPPARLPLLATRLPSLTRVPRRAAWVLPFGSVMLRLEADEACSAREL